MSGSVLLFMLAGAVLMVAYLVWVLWVILHERGVDDTPVDDDGLVGYSEALVAGLAALEKEGRS